jgi:porin
MGRALVGVVIGLSFAFLPVLAWAEDGGEDGAGEVASALDEFLARDRLTGDWWGVRTTLDEMGIEPGGEYTYDFTWLASGGADPPNRAGRYWLNLNLGLDLETLAGIPGLSLYGAYWQMGGEYGSADVGVWQEVSVIESENRHEFAELYAELTFLDSFRAKVGKMDVAYEFAYSDYTDDFMNLCEGWPPSLVGMPTYPDPACGAAILYEPDEGPQFALGAFDGAGSEGAKTGIRGVGTLFGPPSAWYLIAEAGFRGEVAGVPVRPYAGAWSHTGDFEEFSGRTRNGTVGAYGGLDLTLFTPDEGDDEGDGAVGEGEEGAEEESAEEEEEEEVERGLHLILRCTSANEHVSGVERHYVAALCWQGPFAGRASDTTGLAYMYGNLSDDDAAEFTHESEQVIELYYKLMMTPFLSVSPSVQYIVNPGGTEKNALVFGVRLHVVF